MDYLVLDPAIADDSRALRALEPGDLGFAGRDDADRTGSSAYTNDDGPVRYYAYDRDGRQVDVPLRAPARPRPSTRSPPMEPFAFTARDGLDDPRLPHLPARLPSGGRCRPSSTSTAGRGRATPGATTPRRSGSRTAATSASRSTTAARPATARSSSTPATASGAARCTTTCVDAVDHVVEQGWADRERIGDLRRLVRRLRRARGRRRSRRTSSAARSTSSARRTSRR